MADGDSSSFQQVELTTVVSRRVYLSPEPLLVSPQFTEARASVGVPTPTYAYASNNPIAYSDDNGLHDTNGCKFGGGCMACRAEALKMKSGPIRDCVLAQCISQDTKLKCDKKVKDDCEKGNDPRNNTKKGGKSALGSPKEPVKEVNWCEVKQSDECQAKALVHELAHSCGWQHGQDPGVPGNSGPIPNCAEVK